MDEKYVALKAFFAENPRCAVAFSGGADSTFLLHAAHSFGTEVCAYYVKSAFQPGWEQRDAVRFAEDIGAKLVVLETDILALPSVAVNDAQRCYYCKRAIFSEIIKHARADGYTVLLDGTNASDEAADRPGMRALSELAVLSPLRLCGLSKADVYRLSRLLGLPSADKPAYACLATRIPVGRPISADLLARVEKAEDALFVQGFRDFRVRVRGDGALLQLTKADQEAFTMRRDVLTALLGAWFTDVRLDPEPRRGM